MGYDTHPDKHGLYQPENSDVRRLALSDCGHEVPRPFARAGHFVGLPSGALS